MAFRRSTAILFFMVTAISILIFSAVVMVDYRQAMIIENPLLDVRFEHKNHKEEPCAYCHHNFVDGSAGGGGCYDCHKYSEGINVEIEHTFHDFCMNCHIEKAEELLDTGPRRQCSLCHMDDQIVD